MNVVYHGNCYDGAFSAHTMYIFLNLFQKYSTIESLPLWIVDVIKKFPQDLFNNKEIELKTNCLEYFKNIPEKLEESFYICDKINHYYSVIPGKFTTNFINQIVKQGNKQIIFLLDCYGQKLENIEYLSEQFKMVIIIDHHTSAKQTLKTIKSQNVFYYFDERKCAFQLVLDFLTTYMKFNQICPKEIFQYLKLFSIYISINDLKLNENLKSKHFSLGLYWFQIETTDRNPLIFKRLSNLSLEFILQKGKNLYPEFLQDLSKALKFTLIINIEMKNIKLRALGLKVKQFNLVSDLGKILSHYAVINGFSNVVIFFREEFNKKQYRISFRSNRNGKDPLALRLALELGGGGHLLAAACKIENKVFKRFFKIAQYIKSEISDIQKMLII